MEFFAGDCLSGNDAVEDTLRTRLGSVLPGGTGVSPVLSGRAGRAARAPWPRAKLFTKKWVALRIRFPQQSMKTPRLRAIYGSASGSGKNIFRNLL